MTENPISISNLNDFIFCPMSIYFHMLYGETDNMQMQSHYQLNGKAVHDSIDNNRYSSATDVLQGISVISEKYGVYGKIDLYYSSLGLLVERKRQIKQIYDGYLFQLYAQCFGLREQGYVVKKLQLYSYVDNKKYDVALPENNPEMLASFEQLLVEMRRFDMNVFIQSNQEKCSRCIYEPACDRSLKE